MKKKIIINPVTVNNFWSNYYVKYKNKGDRKTLSVKKYLNKIRPYLKGIIQSTITISFISSKVDNDEEHVMHWKSDNTEIMINDKSDEVIE